MNGLIFEGEDFQMTNYKMRMCVAAMLAACWCLSNSPALAVQFPDKNLEAALRHYILDKREGTAELTDDDLKKIFVFDPTTKGIKDLTGLEKCPNIALIKLDKNEIENLTALKDLKNLQSLDLSNNKISDITPLAGLTGLQYLKMENNQVKDIAPLKELKKLSALYMSGNQIADLAPLAEISKLSSLDLAGNKVVDLKPIENVSGLSLLKLTGNEIVDLAPLSKQTQLRMLFIDKNKITDLAPLVAVCKTDADGKKNFAPYLRLFMKENPLSDTAKGEQTEALKKMGVRLEMP